MTFGLNALHGKHQVVPKVWEGAWDPTNAYDFIKYTVSKGYKIDAWELGNALIFSGHSQCYQLSIADCKKLRFIQIPLCIST